MIDIISLIDFWLLMAVIVLFSAFSIYKAIRIIEESYFAFDRWEDWLARPREYGEFDKSYQNRINLFVKLKERETKDESKLVE